MSDLRDEVLEATALRAQELAKSGRPDEAVALVRTLPRADHFPDWLHEKTIAFIAIAVAFAEQGMFVPALDAAREAVSVSELLSQGSAWKEADALADIGSVLVRAGAMDEGVRCWTKAVALCQEGQARDEECGKIIAQVSVSLADAGFWGEAKEAAESIRLEWLRNRTVNELRNRQRGYVGRGIPD